MNNNNKFNKNEAHKSNQNQNVEKNYNKNASQSGAEGQRSVEPKHGKTESKEHRSESNYESLNRESKR